MKPQLIFDALVFNFIYVEQSHMWHECLEFVFSVCVWHNDIGCTRRRSHRLLRSWKRSSLVWRLNIWTQLLNWKTTDGYVSLWQVPQSYSDVSDILRIYSWLILSVFYSCGLNLTGWFSIRPTELVLCAGEPLRYCPLTHSQWSVMMGFIVNPLPHGDANRHTIFKRKN